MDILLNSVADVAKHLIQSNYLNYDDQRLNLLLYSLLGIVFSLIIKFFNEIFQNNLYKNFIWFFNYKILQQKNFMFPLFDTHISANYSMYKIIENDKDKTNNLEKFTYLDVQNPQILYKIMYYLMEKYKHDNQNYYCHYYNFKTHEDEDVDVDEDGEQIKKNKLLKIECISNNKIHAMLSRFHHIEIKKEMYYIIAMVDGYYIYMNPGDLKYQNEYVPLYCKKRCAIEKLLKHFQDIYNKNITFDSKELKILEWKEKSLENIATVKTNLIMDYYVSRYKPKILKHLNAFKNGHAFGNNCFLENNLGILLHGTYGTGKSFLISAISNYLNRSIININFIKINTITEFRNIFNHENNEKYIYCFDEFDYLLTYLFENNNNNNEDIKMRINVLSSQITSMKDNKEATTELIKQMKDLMETGLNDNLTYEFLLSELSGIGSSKNRIIIATTNFIDRIPPALKRPGRFDLILELGKFNNDEICELLEKIYFPNEQQLKKIKKTIYRENTFTPAEIIMKSCEYNDLEDMIKYLST